MATTTSKLQLLTIGATADEFIFNDAPVPSDVFITIPATSAGTVKFQLAARGTNPATLTWTAPNAWAAGANVTPFTLTANQSLFAIGSIAACQFICGY